MLGQFQFGVMQGRLLPKYQGRYQAHPVGYWQEEFYLAKAFGLELIEFILDFSDAEKNPLMNPKGLSEIQHIMKTSGVLVKSVCADYFMEAPLHSINPETIKTSQNLLLKLVDHAASIGVRDVVIPCVDQSRLKDDHDKVRFIQNIKPATRKAEMLGINLSLETDLPPRPFVELLDAIDSNSVTINYDIGNSAALGYDPIEEFETFGDRISDIHVKDRTFRGGSVPLGQGNANFKKVMRLISNSKYCGPLIFQAYRDDEGKKVFRDQLDWFQNKFGF